MAPGVRRIGARRHRRRRRSGGSGGRRGRRERRHRRRGGRRTRRRPGAQLPRRLAGECTLRSLVRVLLWVLRLGRDARDDVPSGHGLRRRRGSLRTRRCVLLEWMLRDSRSAERRMCRRAKLHPRRRDVRRRPRLLFGALPLGDLRGRGTGMQTGGGALRDRSRVLRSRLRASRRGRLDVRAPAGVPTRRRDVHDAHRLLLGAMRRGRDRREALRRARAVHDGRQENLHPSGRGRLQGRQSVLFARLPHDRRRNQALRSLGRVPRGVRALRRRVRLLLGRVRYRHGRRHALPAGVGVRQAW